MSARPWDVRLRRPHWDPLPSGMPVRRRVRLLALLGLPLIVWYLSWLLSPRHVGTPVLYGLLLAAEGLNVLQAVGFWWTCSFERVREACPPTRPHSVDVLIPRYDEPAEIVELTVAAAAELRGADVRVWLLDDGDDEEMRAVAQRHGVGYLRRDEHTHAKAGNVNHALACTDAPYVAIVDCDHVVEPGFLEDVLGHFESDERLAFVQTPQYYANGDRGGVPGAAWAQQTLFFGAIARGKDGLGATFCCGTNVVFRRAALEDTGGFPTHSVTEDFELSIDLHSRGWHSAYLPKVLARGLGPEDMGAYVTQQLRWARGCLSALPRVLTARLPWRLRAQYLLSAVYWMSGWTVLVYMSFPVIRILFGIQPLSHLTAPEFLLHFAPYFAVAVSTAALAGTGAYTFAGLALSASVFWVHMVATVLTAARRKGSFKVTPKQGTEERQLGAVAVPLVAVAVLLGVSIYGLISVRDAATFNNAAFALMHVTILLAGSWAALRGPGRKRRGGLRAALAGTALAVLLGGCAGGSAASDPPTGAARAFLSRYAAPSGRVVRTDQGGDTVSEGQAYGMLAAAALGDRPRFDAIWGWTKTHLARRDGLFSWHWAGGRVADAQAASDADLEIARALLVGGCRWHDTGLTRSGTAVGRAILAHETARRGGRLVLAAGPWATGSPVTVNPSYVDPAALRALAAATGDGRFTALADGSRDAIAAVSHPLPPDWATIDDGGHATPSGPPGRVVPASYGFDAARTLVWMATGGHADATLARAAWPALRARSAGSPVFGVAGAAAAVAAGDVRGRDRMLAAATRAQDAHPTYYGAAWLALGRLLLTSDRLHVCTSTPRTTS